ncbi:DNA polymerase III subunit delta [Candidatus Epulonipiscium fishelsonii]|uniref:DNA polymerase III subunit delta n=1 Tax=Candidatus Epulonipiscium fishelsonii TaxID=77094 RepID=A0ACC8XI70_9FIRM|nr:DNA polymerase III subunit delta [Epulopiscium sp. SCG-D08WGA-EpuloA1]OON90269.1 MAG: DNA polymerase III subunit delta [Epulopiscium sp. AS2M-Bin002]
MIYLLYGTEEWIKNKRLNEIKANTLGETPDLMNYTYHEGNRCNIDAIISQCETMPFFSEYKLIVIKNSNLFKSGRKEDTEKLSEWLKNIPSYVVMVFAEYEIDKRNKLFKAINKEGTVESCDYPNTEEIYKLLTSKASLKKEVFYYFINNMPKNILYILNEYEKLISYCDGRIITKKDIDILCNFDAEQQVFELIKYMGTKQTTKCIKIYTALIEAKEYPIKILILIARQYRLMLQTKYLVRSNIPAIKIATELNIPLFVAKELVNQAEEKTFDKIQEILKYCLETDEQIKTGKMEPVKSVELLIMKCIYI